VITELIETGKTAYRAIRKLRRCAQKKDAPESAALRYLYRMRSTWKRS